MNKNRLTLLLLSMLLVLTACSSSTPTDQKDVGSILPSLGHSKETVFGNLALTDTDVTTSAQLPDVYFMKEERFLHGQSFMLALRFDTETDTMKDFIFLKDFQESPKEGYELAQKLHAAYMKQYGEAIAETDEQSRMINMPDFTEWSKGAVSYYTESWKTSEGVTVTLQINFTPDNGVRITVQYAK